MTAAFSIFILGRFSDDLRTVLTIKNNGKQKKPKRTNFQALLFLFKHINEAAGYKKLSISLVITPR
jgi:hypothetical protein